ncbi:NIPSNAP family protein [Rossellomorea aquimaris]|uniref:NIPSNAP family protein n=1 Tax=Rossellomorea aquimaris TaxID=189382 RepID=UPI001CD3ADE9|nr:NIPSNAP family protein [Rossellomorea aquimaris]MCA1053687.1 NIPSNAP family protein [Rossellomorea aquimaris]
MVYRVRTYRINPQQLERFTTYFHEYLLPNQIRFGSRLIGRWVNESKTSITAIWLYENKNQYHEIENKIKRTNLHKQAQQRKKDLEPLFLSTHQEFWEMTGPYKDSGGEQ